MAGTQSEDQDLSQEQSAQNDHAIATDPDLEGLELDEQPSKEDSTDAPEAEEGQQEQTVEIDGEEVPISQLREWKKGNMRQEDYTKKTQAISEERRRLARGAQKQALNTDKIAKDPAAQQALAALKSLGVMTQDEIEDRFKSFEIGQQEEKALSGLIASNPSLKPFEKAIREIGKNSGAAWEDIIANYGFMPRTALQRAKSSKQIVGNSPAKKPATQKGAENVDIMTDAEFDAWEKANVTGNQYRKQSK